MKLQTPEELDTLADRLCGEEHPRSSKRWRAVRHMLIEANRAWAEMDGTHPGLLEEILRAPDENGD